MICKTHQVVLLRSEGERDGLTEQGQVQFIKRGDCLEGMQGAG